MSIKAIARHLTPPSIWSQISSFKCRFNQNQCLDYQNWQTILPTLSEEKHLEALKEVEKNEEIRLNQLERYTETETLFLNKKLKIVDNASFQFIKKELFESEIYKFNCKNEHPYIIDCGANIGLSVIYFKQLFPNAEIIAFEPDERVFKTLQFNLKSFQLSNVTSIKKACWHDETSLKFYSEGADGGRAALNSDLENIIEVQTIRLREFLKRKVDFLKMDIEGAETKVLEDCADLLVNVEKIFVEYHSFEGQEQSLGSLLKLLATCGFRFQVQHIGVFSPHPFIQVSSNNNIDLQLNIFAYK